MLYYLPAITFTASAPSQLYEEIAGGGREIGGTPRLRLNWKQPKIYYDPDFDPDSNPGVDPYPQNDPDTGNGSFIEANTHDALQFMQHTYNSVYIDTPREIVSLNYLINISTDANKLDSGSSQSSIQLMQREDDVSYEARVSGTTGVSALIPGANSWDSTASSCWAGKMKHRK